MTIHTKGKKVSALLPFLIASSIFCLTQIVSAAASLEEPQKVQDTSFAVSLTFLPVSLFDDDNNQRMSDKLASVFMQDALSEHFKSKKEIDLTKIKRTDHKKTDREWTVTYEVPLDAIRDAGKEPVPVAIDVIRKYYPSESVNNSLREPKAIYLHDLKIAEAIFLGQITGGKRISEQRITMAFDTFEKKVKADDSLFLSDKDVFLSQAKTIREYLLKKKAERDATAAHVSEAAETVKRQSVEVSKASMLPEFEPMLMCSDVLLKAGGCMVFRTDDGNMYLISVGTAAVKDDSAQDRILQQKVAEQRAYSEIAKYTNLEVTAFSQLSVQSDKNESSKQFTEKITLRAEEYMSGLPTVGTWYSADGKVFFLAKGQKL